jgi:hypothetical protein
MFWLNDEPQCLILGSRTRELVIHIFKVAKIMSLQKDTTGSGVNARMLTPEGADQQGQALLDDGSSDYDLFVSYARKDNVGNFVDTLVAMLIKQYQTFFKESLKVFIDHSEIKVANDWEYKFLRALGASKAMLIVISDAYFDSHYCRQEWLAFQDREAERAMLGEAIAPVYLSTSEMFESSEPAEDLETADDWVGNLRRRQYIDLREAYSLAPALLSEKTAEPALQALAKGVREIVQIAIDSRISPSTVPQPSPQFSGRRRELRAIREKLGMGKAQAVVALHGLPGIGKTMLAFAYARSYAREYPGGRFLVSFEGAGDLRVPMMTLAPELGVKLSEADSKDLTQAYREVRKALESRPRSLLVFDNLDDPESLSPQLVAEQLPHSDYVHVLATTRLEPECIPSVISLPTEALAKEDAVRILGKHRPPRDEDERRAVDAIVECLGRFTLAVEIVGAYLRHHQDITYGDYLTRLEDGGINALESSAAEKDVVKLAWYRDKSLSKVLEPTIDRLNPTELVVAGYAALLPPNSIPLSWLRILAHTGAFGIHLPVPLSPNRPGHPDPYQEGFRRLQGLGLLLKTTEPEVARMHRLVGEIIRRTMSAITPSWRDLAVRHAVERAKEYEVDLQSGSFPTQIRWEVETILEFARLLLDESHVGGAVLASVAVSMGYSWILPNEDLLQRSINVLTQLDTATRLKCRGLITSLYVKLLDEMVVRYKYDEARRLLDNAVSHLRELNAEEEVERFRDGLLEYINGWAAGDEYALQKMVDKYKDELRTLGPDHEETKATSKWLQENFPESWKQASNEHELEEMERKFCALLEDFGPNHHETRRFGEELYERSGAKVIPPWRLNEFIKSLKRDPEPED